MSGDTEIDVGDFVQVFCGGVKPLHGKLVKVPDDKNDCYGLSIGNKIYDFFLIKNFDLMRKISEQDATPHMHMNGRKVSDWVKSI